MSFVNALTVSAGDPDVMVIGDLNAYGAEDPVFTLTAAGLVDQPLRFDATPHSYVFDGEKGTLDHGLATASLSARVVGAVHWHVNADEPSVIDYITDFKTQDLYTPTAYRSSDHDPVLIGIDLQGAQAQTISFTGPSDQVLGAASFTVTASATSGLAVAFTSQTPAVCTLAGSTVQLVAAGTCSIAANQAGNANFLPAPQVVRSFVVRQAQSLSFAPLASLSLSQGGFTLAATATSGLPVIYASTTPAVCTVAGAAVTLVSAGSCSLTASQPGNGLWAPATAVTQIFAVTAAPTAADGDVPLPLWALGLLGAGLMAGLRRSRVAR
jgi:uncharacterized protein